MVCEWLGGIGCNGTRSTPVAPSRTGIRPPNGPSTRECPGGGEWPEWQCSLRAGGRRLSITWDSGVHPWDSSQGTQQHGGRCEGGWNSQNCFFTCQVLVDPEVLAHPLLLCGPLQLFLLLYSPHCSAPLPLRRASEGCSLIMIAAAAAD